ncbi:hypothetical protein LJC35_05170 [Parabacteroides sp. OttesenSCG-928-N08]|nr:hypothetical protein [Parabacteroides sp. OttesenSCG-928-N08]
MKQFPLFEMPWLTPLGNYGAGYRGLTSTSTEMSKLRFCSVARIETRHATSVLPLSLQSQYRLRLLRQHQPPLYYPYRCNLNIAFDYYANINHLCPTPIAISHLFHKA